MGSTSGHRNSHRMGRSAALVAVLAGACMGYGQVGPGSRAEPGKPPPGRPEAPAPDFVPPQPNKGIAPSQPDAGEAEHPQFVVGAIVVRYDFDHPQLPGVDDLQKTMVTLGRTIEGYIMPTPGVPSETFALEEIALRPAARFSAGAINVVSRAIRDEINNRGILGVFVTPSDKEFTIAQSGDEESKDLRKPGQTAITLVVRALLVREMRTLAFGDRIPSSRAINADEHRRVLENSPVRVYSPDDSKRLDILRKDLLDDYVFRLNRQPGRRVDIAVSAADPGRTTTEVEGLAVDLLVTENRPWFAYFQVSNTGTKQTNEWRERFGFVNNQLTGHDDVLSVDFITAGFDASYAFVASYERPLYGDWLRGRVFGNWNEYTASDVGQTNEKFSGNGYTIGGELVANVFQHRETFIDVSAGLRYQFAESTNNAVPNQSGGGNLRGKGEFLLPTFGTRLERFTETSVTNLALGIEFNVEQITDPSGNRDPRNNNRQFIDQMGRTNPDASWTALNWDMAQSFYLDPFYFGSAWEDVGPNGHPTLAHELAFAFRGQYAFNNRLIPNFEQVAGGMFSVRGYPESIVAGDTVVVGSVEYRFHVPQALGFSPEPGTLFGKSFRYKPQSPYGRADWDLILKGFVDAGQTYISRKLADEQEHTLVGAGVGAEFLFKRNLSVRVDWGVALREVLNPNGTTEVKDGSNRFHILATILF